MEAAVIPAALWLVPGLPALGVLISYGAGFRNKDWSGWLASAASLASFLAVLFFALLLQPGQILESRLCTWMAVQDLQVSFLLRFDQLTAVMALVVTGVGSIIHWYAISYMAEDPGRPRFFAYLNLFMFAMLLLVLGGNLPLLFVGWEGVGLCSYLLIGFWHRNPAFAAAGRKAFVVNRIGDAGFLVGMFLLFKEFGSLDFSELSALIRLQPDLTSLYVLIGLCLFVGACGKSAQIPLFVWLPDAMAGPTPVSALIHAATMVTAGVYMMARMHFLFSLAPAALLVVSIIAALTAFIAATIALTQFDIKKVLAYSTVSQLGFMFLACAAGAYEVAIFHVVTHAFFKACLFLGAGSVIHGCHHEQDMRHMGGLASRMPVTAATYLIATLAIAGIAPLAGYYSKHAILLAFEHHTNPLLEPIAELVLLLASLAAFMTAFYMTRSFALTFLGRYRGHAEVHESPRIMTSALVILAACSAGGGIVLTSSLPLFEYLAPVLPTHLAHAHETWLQGLVNSWIGLSGIFLSLLCYVWAKNVPAQIFGALRPLSGLVQARYCLDEAYALLIVRPAERLAYWLWSIVDQRGIDGIVNGVASLLRSCAEVVRLLQTGQVRTYASIMFLAVAGVLSWYVLY